MMHSGKSFSGFVQEDITYSVLCNEAMLQSVLYRRTSYRMRSTAGRHMECVAQADIIYMLRFTRGHRTVCCTWAHHVACAVLRRLKVVPD